MKYIQTGRRKSQESDFCPHCKSNVFKQYKAIHNGETHITLFGEPCPNNGRHNAAIWGENVGIKLPTAEESAEMKKAFDEWIKKKEAG